MITVEQDKRTGRLRVVGAPDGVTLAGVANGSDAQLLKLSIYRVDLERSIAYCDAASKISDAVAHEGLMQAALLSLVRCFDSTTKGLRDKPLSRRVIYDHQQRDQLSELEHLRNKSIAHDEQLFSGHFSIVMINGDAQVCDYAALHLVVPFCETPQSLFVKPLAEMALRWVELEIGRLAAELITSLNTAPLEERLSVAARGTDYFIDVTNGGSIGDMVRSHKAERAKARRK